MLASPLVGVSVDALVLLGRRRARAAATRGGCCASPRARSTSSPPTTTRTARAVREWFAGERAGRCRGVGVEELIERALDADRLRPRGAGAAGRPAAARERAQADAPRRASTRPRPGRDIRGFLELVRAERRAGAARRSRESEAPVEGEALDAVRLMTIHRAKGLEFEIVCVADLGRGPRWFGPMMRVGRDGRFGLRLAQPGTGRRESALALQGARRGAAAGRRARGAAAVLRRDDARAGAADAERRREARIVAVARAPAGRSGGSARRCWADVQPLIERVGGDRAGRRGRVAARGGSTSTIQCVPGRTR